jgi:hypothetical protein
MEVSAVRITYWNADGRYRRKRGQITGELPRHLLNGGDRQAHSLSEDPIYVQSEDPLYLKTPAERLRWLDLTGNLETDAGGISFGVDGWVKPVPVPPPPAKGEGLSVLVEEGAIYPVSCIPYSDLEARQKEQADTHAEAYALAAAREARSGADNGLMKASMVVLLGVAVVLVIVIAIVALQARFGEQPLPVPVVPAESPAGASSVIKVVDQWL